MSQDTEVSELRQAMDLYKQWYIVTHHTVSIMMESPNLEWPLALEDLVSSTNILENNQSPQSQAVKQNYCVLQMRLIESQCLVTSLANFETKRQMEILY